MRKWFSFSQYLIIFLLLKIIVTRYKTLLQVQVLTQVQPIEPIIWIHEHWFCFLYSPYCSINLILSTLRTRQSSQLHQHSLSDLEVQHDNLRDWDHMNQPDDCYDPGVQPILLYALESCWRIGTANMVIAVCSHIHISHKRRMMCLLPHISAHKQILTASLQLTWKFFEYSFFLSKSWGATVIFISNFFNGFF